jgi:predicted RNase H-like HicB family nuclease
MKNLICDIKDTILYDLLKKPLPEIKNLSWNLDFVLHKVKGKGMWLEAKDYPGLIASGDTPEELREAVFDAILTYFDVPTAAAKRLPDTLILRLPGGKEVRPKASPCWQITVATA